MNEVTQILSAIEQGDPHAPEQLLPLVHDALRRLATQRLAQESPGQTLQPTALVHEVYLRLVGSERGQHWDISWHCSRLQPKPLGRDDEIARQQPSFDWCRQ